MKEKFNFFVARLRERLWFKPLSFCVLSIVAVLLASLLDMTYVGNFLPEFSAESTEALLKLMASSMLVMATFSVGAMVSAYASASNAATPRTFLLIIADDVSQNALSAFIGAFIYSVVALVALTNGHFDGKASLLVLFAMTMVVFGIVILSFIWWVDNIARLGRLGYTVDKVESAADVAIRKRQMAPRLGGIAAFHPPSDAHAVFAKIVGYVQHVHTGTIQEHATRSRLRVLVSALPGTFCTPSRPIAWIIAEESEGASQEDIDEDIKMIANAFVIGDSRVFDQDPRFGLIVLSEIASRALSPAVNDPGTAIDVVHTLLRLLLTWHESSQTEGEKTQEVRYDRVAVPELSMDDLFDDAFAAIARDGAGTIEVVVRLLKCLEALAAVDDQSIKAAAIAQARFTLARAEKAMTLPHDLNIARELAAFAR